MSPPFDKSVGFAYGQGMSMRATHTSELLTTFRLDAEVTQKQAAEMLGVTKRQIERWEAREHFPNRRAVEAVAPKMGLLPSDFYEETLSREERLEAVEVALQGVTEELAKLNRRLATPQTNKALVAAAVEQLLDGLPQALRGASPARAAGAHAGERRAPRSQDRSPRAAAQPSGS